MKVLARHGEKIVIMERVLENVTVAPAPDFRDPLKTKRGLLSPLAYRSSAIRQARARFRKEV